VSFFIEGEIKMINCVICRKGLSKTKLIVIQGQSYCPRCLNNIQVKATGEIGRYYTHAQDRIFISFKSKDTKGINVKEFRLNEIEISRSFRI
jgi:hypothetical protein